MRSVVFAVAVALVMGCSAGSVDPDLSSGEDEIAVKAPGSGASRTPAPGDGVATTLRPAPKALQLLCRPDAFCEDFEAVDPTSHWTGKVVSTGGALAFVGPSASLGAQSLHVTATPDGAAYLRLDGGYAPATWAGALTFAIDVAAPPSRRVAGPELAVGEARIVLSYSRDTLVIEQRYGADFAYATVVATPAFGAWQRVAIGLEVNESSAAPYGRLEVSVDGGELHHMPLAVPLYGGTRELRAGVTAPDLADANVSLDDIVFFAP
jgi:hypothetical protein